MRLADLGVICCCGCGRNDVPLHKLPEAMSLTLRACATCLAKFGAVQLAAEADRLIATATPGRGPVSTRCLHCGNPVLNGAAWCAECENERQKLMGA